MEPEKNPKRLRPFPSPVGGMSAGLNRVEVAAVLRQIKRMLGTKANGEHTTLGRISRAEDPFRVLISTILSSRTRDGKTYEASKRLFEAYGSVKDLASADEDKVRVLIRPVGFYNVKAKRIIEVSRMLLERFKGRVPDDLEKLLTLPSVGRKTANCVLVYGYAKPAIPVDTHVHRISNRLGLVKTTTPEETEKKLTEIVPKNLWLDVNELFVRFGQTVCLPVRPRCSFCSFGRSCKYYGETKVGCQGKD